MKSITELIIQPTYEGKNYQQTVHVAMSSPDLKVMLYGEKIYSQVQQKQISEVGVSLMPLIVATTLENAVSLRDMHTAKTFEHLFFTSIQLKNPQHILNISDLPQFGLSSGTRKLMLDAFVERYPDLSIFHANVIVNKKGEAIVFASSGIMGDGSNKGKTTASFASFIRSDSQFSFLTNDDLILATIGNKIIFLPWPSEIVVRHDLMTHMKTLGYNVKHSFEEVEGKSTNYLVTATDLENSSYNVTNSFTKIKAWIFMDLVKDPNGINTLTKIENTISAQEMFDSSVRRRRMMMKHTPTLHMEHIEISERSELTSTELTHSQRLFRLLQSDGCNMYTMSGGVNRENIFNAVSSINDTNE